MSRADTVVASVRLTCSTCTADGAAGGVITGSATAMRPINAVTAAPGSTRRPISVSVAPACSPSGNTLRRHAPLTPPRPSTFSTAPIRSTACSRDGPAPVRWTISNWLSPVSFNDVANSRTSLADRGVPVIFSAVPPSYGSSQSSDGTTLVPVPVTLHRHVGSTSCSDRLCHACVERTVPVDRELLPVPGVEVRHERQRGDRRQLGDVVGDALPRGGRRGVRRVAVRADPEPVVPRVEVGGARRRLESPLRTVEAEGRRVRFALGEDRRPAYARVVAVRLDVHTGREVVRAAAQLPGERRRVRQALRAPPEVEEHLVRLLEERPVPGGQRVLPGDAAGVGHRVVPDDPQPAPADVPDEVTHVLCELGVAAGRLLVEEPAVEPVVPRDLDHLVRHREPVAVALHEVADPLEPAAVRVRREEHVAEHAHPVAVRGVGDGRVRREDQALGRGIAPEHQFVDVLPVVRGVVVHVERALGRVVARRRVRHQRLHSRFPDVGVRVGGSGRDDPFRQRHRAAVVPRVPIRRRVPGEDRGRVPVRRVRLGDRLGGRGSLGQQTGQRRRRAQNEELSPSGHAVHPCAPPDSSHTASTVTASDDNPPICCAR